MRMAIATGKTPTRTRSRSAAWADHALGTIASAGHRQSTPRADVIRVLSSQQCVLTAREIADALRDSGSDVGIATVYRALELLDALGLVHRLDTREGSTRYEPAHPTGEHHHHIVCDSCGRVSQFEDAELERAIHEVARRLDYKVGAHDVVLRGDCPRCA
jgi:Fur family ferric uptake transcriptional regulator